MSQDSWELWSSPHSTCHWCRRRQSPFWGANLPWDSHETSRNEIPKDESCFQGFAVRVQSFNCLSVESGEGRSMVLAIQKRKVSFYKTYPCCCEIRDNDHWINPCQCLPKENHLSVERLGNPKITSNFLQILPNFRPRFHPGWVKSQLWRSPHEPTPWVFREGPIQRSEAAIGWRLETQRLMHILNFRVQIDGIHRHFSPCLMPSLTNAERLQTYGWNRYRYQLYNSNCNILRHILRTQVLQILAFSAISVLYPS